MTDGEKVAGAEDAPADKHTTDDAPQGQEGDFESAFSEFAGKDDTLADGETIVPDAPAPDDDDEPAAEAAGSDTPAAEPAAAEDIWADA